MPVNVIWILPHVNRAKVNKFQLIINKILFKNFYLLLLFIDLTDYSSLYCAMDAYLCEDGYEHWTIFFGHEKD